MQRNLLISRFDAYKIFDDNKIITAEYGDGKNHKAWVLRLLFLNELRPSKFKLLK